MTLAEDRHDSLIDLMAHNHWTCAQVAKIVGCSVSSVRNWRAGRPPPATALARLHLAERAPAEAGTHPRGRTDGNGARSRA